MQSRLTLITALLVSFTQAFNEERMICLVNQVRANYGIPPLAMDSRLSNAAQDHSNWMANKKTMSHTGNGGSSPSDRISASGVKWMEVAENVSYGYKDENAAMNAWMKSAGHRQNILSTKFAIMGCGAAGSGDIYYTQDFAKDGSKSLSYPSCSGSKSSDAPGKIKNDVQDKVTKDAQDKKQGGKGGPPDLSSPGWKPLGNNAPEKIKGKAGGDNKDPDCDEDKKQGGKLVTSKGGPPDLSSPGWKPLGTGSSGGPPDLSSPGWKPLGNNAPEKIKGISGGDNKGPDCDEDKKQDSKLVTGKGGPPDLSSPGWKPLGSGSPGGPPDLSSPGWKPSDGPPGKNSTANFTKLDFKKFNSTANGTSVDGLPPNGEFPVSVEQLMKMIMQLVDASGGDLVVTQVPGPNGGPPMLRMGKAESTHI